MSEFTSTFELFTSVVDPQTDDWSSPDNVLDDGSFSEASNWYKGGLELTLPKIPIPGGRPLLPTIVINDLQLQIRWARGGNANSGGTMFLREFDIGGGPLTGPTDEFKSTIVNEPLHTNQLGGDPAYWNVTQLEMIDFMNGDVPFTFGIDTTSTNGSTQCRVAWIKMQAQYTYTGSGIAFPRLF